jgi:DNA-binding cell septation regulator SpoVG
MSAEIWAVTIYRHTSGHLRAFADVSVQTPGGELIMKGCRVMQTNGKGLWVALPSTRYT